MRVVALVPDSSEAVFFRHLLGPRGVVAGAKGLPDPTRHTAPTGARPIWLAAAAGLLLVLLALNELFCGRLSWRPEAAA
jgi:hypothetical protein